MNIVIIEDEVEILAILECMVQHISEVRSVRLFTHWSQYEPQPGDTVVHDMMGVGEPKFIEGVKYISISGCIEADIAKPFRPKDLLNAIESHLQVEAA